MTDELNIKYFYNNSANSFTKDKNELMNMINKDEKLRSCNFFRVNQYLLQTDRDVEDIIYQKRLQIIKSQKKFGFTNNKTKQKLLGSQKKSSHLEITADNNTSDDNNDNNEKVVEEKKEITQKHNLTIYSYNLVGYKQIKSLNLKENEMIGIFNDYCKLSIISNIQSLLSVFDKAFLPYFGKIEPKKLFVQKVRDVMPSVMYSKNDVGILVLRQNIMQNKYWLKYMILYAKSATKKVIIVITGIGTSNSRTFKNKEVDKLSVCDKGTYDTIFGKYLNEKQKDKMLLMTCNNSLAKHQLKVLVNIILQKNTVFYLNYEELNQFAKIV